MNKNQKKNLIIICIIFWLTCCGYSVIVVKDEMQILKILEYNVIILLFSTIASFILKFQIKYTWLNISKNLGKFISIFWIIGSSIGFLWTIINGVIKRELVIVTPIFFIMMMTSIHNYMYIKENDPEQIIKKKKRIVEERNSSKVSI